MESKRTGRPSKKTGSKFRESRVRLGWTIPQTAKHFGVSYSTIWRAETKPKQLAKLMEVSSRRFLRDLEAHAAGQDCTL